MQHAVEQKAGNIQGTFGEHSVREKKSGNIRATFREHSGNIQLKGLVLTTAALLQHLQYIICDKMSANAIVEITYLI
jgi:hypothetical protein